MNWLILSGVIAYMMGMLVVGYLSSKRVKNLEDFLVAGRRLPFYLATATLFATWFGAGTCMGASGIAYEGGFLDVTADPLAAGFALILAGLFYVAFFRRHKFLTVTDIFGRYYSKNSEIFASLLMVPVYVGWLGSQMVAIGFILNALTGLDATVGIIISAVIVLIYTFAGGMWAVTITDFVQVIILIAGLFTIYPIIMDSIGGFEALVEQTPRELWRMTPDNPGPNGWIAYAGQLTLMGLGCIVGQDLIQRSLASKSESVAKTSAVTAGVLYIVIGTIPILLGLAGRIIIPDIANPEHILPQLAMRYLHPVIVMVFLGALVSAIMSSADSSLLAASSLLTNNIILRVSPKAKEGNVLLQVRVATVVVALLSMGVALYVKEIYNLMVNSWATLFVGIFVPVTAAIYWKRANTPAAWSSMILGTGTWIGYILIKGGDFQNVSDEVFYIAAVYGGLASLLSYLLVTLIRKK